MAASFSRRLASKNYPADSFFDVFFDISWDDGVSWLPLPQPVPMVAVIQAIPPILAHYQSPPSLAVPSPSPAVPRWLLPALHPVRAVAMA